MTRAGEISEAMIPRAPAVEDSTMAEEVILEAVAATSAAVETLVVAGTSAEVEVAIALGERPVASSVKSKM